MNDMETEARRLLAAATQDIPPEIDLLGGFAGARRRDRARRTRGRAVLSAGVAAAAAAATAITLTVGSGPPALATVTSALSHTLRQSYHLTQVDRYYSQWKGGPLTEYARNTCTTETDPARDLDELSCTNGLNVREVGRYTYTYSPMATHGKHWMRSLTSQTDTSFPGAINSFMLASPQQMLAQLEKAAKVTVVGPVSGQGWTGTRYSFTENFGNGMSERGTVDVDRQGQTRALDLTQQQGPHFVWKQTLVFSDFGAPVTVVPPPPGQVFPFP
jgi:hypothetical protein